MWPQRDGKAIIPPEEDRKKEAERQTVRWKYYYRETMWPQRDGKVIVPPEGDG